MYHTKITFLKSTMLPYSTHQSDVMSMENIKSFSMITQLYIN